MALKLKLEEIETRPQGLRERLSNRKAEAGQRDYDDGHSILFRRKKADRRACRQIPVAGYLPKKEFVDEGGLMSYGADSADPYGGRPYVDKIFKGANRPIYPYSRLRSSSSSSI